MKAAILTFLFTAFAASSASADQQRQVTLPAPGPAFGATCPNTAALQDCRGDLAWCKGELATCTGADGATIDAHMKDRTAVPRVEKPVVKPRAVPAAPKPPVVAAPRPVPPAATPSPPRIVQGPPGPAGANGADGKDGKDGKDGADGKDGKNGANGRDGRDGRNAEVHVNVGPEVLAFALQGDGYRSMGIGPGVQLQLALSEKTEFTFGGAWLPEGDRASVVHGSVTRFIRPWLGLGGGGFFHRADLLNGRAKREFLTGTLGVALRYTSGRFGIRADLNGMAGTGDLDRPDFVYGASGTVALTWRLD